jgi:hypothetical protein
MPARWQSTIRTSIRAFQRHAQARRRVFMPKAQVLVTVTAEAFVNVPDGVDDVDRYVRDSVSLVWGDADASTMQAPAISVEYFIIPEPQPEPVVEDVVDVAHVESAPETEFQPSDTLPLPVASAALSEPSREQAGTEAVVGFNTLLDDPAYRSILRTAVRDRASELLEIIVDQVVAELEPLLRRHYNKNASGAQ